MFLHSIVRSGDLRGILLGLMAHPMLTAQGVSLFPDMLHTISEPTPPGPWCLGTPSQQILSAFLLAHKDCFAVRPLCAPKPCDSIPRSSMQAMAFRLFHQHSPPSFIRVRVS